MRKALLDIALVIVLALLLLGTHAVAYGIGYDHGLAETPEVPMPIWEPAETTEPTRVCAAGGVRVGCAQSRLELAHPAEDLVDVLGGHALVQ